MQNTRVWLLGTRCQTRRPVLVTIVDEVPMQGLSSSAAEQGSGMKSLYDEHRFRLRARADPRRRPLARAGMRVRVACSCVRA